MHSGTCEMKLVFLSGPVLGLGETQRFNILRPSAAAASHQQELDYFFYLFFLFSSPPNGG